MDNLERFLDWFLTDGPRIGMVPFTGAVGRVDGVTKVTWFKHGQFQVQLFIVSPNYIIPEHTHPNVDSFEIYLGGQINFSHCGRYATNKWADAVADKYGCSPERGMIIRVRPDDLHGGTFGPEGGVFMSVQHWLNGVEPHCVSADYSGIVMGPEHAKGVVFGEYRVKDALTEKDAASLEF